MSQTQNITDPIEQLLWALHAVSHVGAFFLLLPDLSPSRVYSGFFGLLLSLNLFTDHCFAHLESFHL